MQNFKGVFSVHNFSSYDEQNSQYLALKMTFDSQGKIEKIKNHNFCYNSYSFHYFSMKISSVRHHVVIHTW